MELKRNIGFLGMFSLATGAMISSGIFILPSMAFGLCGPSVSIAYILAGLLALLGIQSIIELSTAMPKAGGDYFFVNRSLGPLFGTFSGVLGWIALSLKSAFAVFGISEVLFLLFDFPLLISGAIIITVFVILNSIGAKEAAIFQTILVFFLISILVFFIGTGIPNIDLTNFTPFVFKLDNIIYASAFVFISFGGLLKIANVAEEVKNPGKNIPLGITVSIICATVLYALSVFVITGILSPENFINSGAPVADAARISMGKTGYIIVTIGAILAFVTTANAGIMAASRYPLSMGRDGLIPQIFSKVNKKGMPFLSIAFTGIIMFLSLLFSLEVLVKVASTVILTSYIMTNLSVIVFRESHLVNYRPIYKTKFYPWVQIFCVGIFSYFIYRLGSESAGISILFIFLSLFVYLFYGKKRYEGEAAVLHVIRRITDDGITEGMLENELRQIVIGRDGIIQREFEDLVRVADIFDIDEKINFSELLKKVAPVINHQCGLETEEIIYRFKEREDLMTTVLTPYIAVPHIITDEEDAMFLVIARCKKGIKFSDEGDSIKAVFLFGGPLAERNLHIKILSGIAEKVSEDGFAEKWETAKEKTQLKEIFISKPKDN